MADAAGVVYERGRDNDAAFASLSMRSLRITSAEQLDDPALIALIGGATRIGVPPARA